MIIHSAGEKALGGTEREFGAVLYIWWVLMGLALARRAGLPTLYALVRVGVWTSTNYRDFL